MPARRRRSTRKGGVRRTRSARRAYKPTKASQDAMGRLRKANTRLRSRLKAGNPLPRTDNSGELESLAYIIAGGAASGWVERNQETGMIPSLGPLKPEMLVAAALLAVAYSTKGKIAVASGLTAAGMLAGSARSYVATVGYVY
jgi:hypothetical protein